MKTSLAVLASFLLLSFASSGLYLAYCEFARGARRFLPLFLTGIILTLSLCFQYLGLSSLAPFGLLALGLLSWIMTVKKAGLAGLALPFKDPFWLACLFGGLCLGLLACLCPDREILQANPAANLALGSLLGALALRPISSAFLIWANLLLLYVCLISLDGSDEEKDSKAPLRTLWTLACLLGFLAPQVWLRLLALLALSLLPPMFCPSGFCKGGIYRTLAVTLAALMAFGLFISARPAGEILPLQEAAPVLGLFLLAVSALSFCKAPGLKSLFMVLPAFFPAQTMLPFCAVFLPFLLALTLTVCTFVKIRREALPPGLPSWLLLLSKILCLALLLLYGLSASECQESSHNSQGGGFLPAFEKALAFSPALSWHADSPRNPKAFKSLERLLNSQCRDAFGKPVLSLKSLLPFFALLLLFVLALYALGGRLSKESVLLAAVLLYFLLAVFLSLYLAWLCAAGQFVAGADMTRLLFVSIAFGLAVLLSDGLFRLSKATFPVLLMAFLSFLPTALLLFWLLGGI